MDKNACSCLYSQRRAIMSTRDTQLFYRRDAMLQRLRITGRDLNERVHIVKILALPVHYVFKVHPGRNGAVQLLKVLPGVRNVAHPAAVHHGLLGDLRQNFSPWIACQSGTKC